MMRFRHAITAFAVILLFSALATAQAPAAGGQRAGGPPAEPPKNLQVLPKDMPREQVVNIMRAFTAGLGVQCGYCHTFIGPNDPGNDFASDSKTPKLVARVMMQMTGEINQKLAANIKKPADQIARVGCMTCHRGAAIPTTPPPAPAPGAPAAPGGAPATPGGAPAQPGR